MTKKYERPLAITLDEAAGGAMCSEGANPGDGGGSCTNGPQANPHCWVRTAASGGCQTGGEAVGKCFLGQVAPN